MKSAIDPEWHAIPEWEGVYEITIDGRIRRVGRQDSIRRRAVPREMQPRVVSCNGRQVTLCTLGSTKAEFVHRLVARTFIGPCPPGLVVNHKDGDRGNNHRDNLEYVTTRENNVHAIRELGKPSPKGSEQWMAKLTESDIPVMRSMKARGVQIKDIASHFHVAVTTAYSVFSGHTWKHVP